MVKRKLVGGVGKLELLKKSKKASEGKVHESEESETETTNLSNNDISGQKKEKGKMEQAACPRILSKRDRFQLMWGNAGEAAKEKHRSAKELKGCWLIFRIYYERYGKVVCFLEASSIVEDIAERLLILTELGNHEQKWRARHLMMDLRTLMPHSRADNKLDRKESLFIINEVCEMKNCNKCVFFEMRKKKDLYMWIANIPHGPSARFLVENVHTMDELKLAGNCLKGSRPILSFDKKFDESVQYTLLKTLFTQIFATPYQHPKSKPFVDRVMTFSAHDNRIWIRNYQIVNESDMSLTEIGPRFVLNLIRIFSGSFGGSTLYENPHYVSPNEYRRRIRQQAAFRYLNKKHAKEQSDLRRAEMKGFVQESLDDIFHTITQADLNEAQGT